MRDTLWRLGVVVSVIGRINEVNQHRAQLVHDAVTISNQPPGSTQPYIPTGSLNRVYSFGWGKGGNVTSAGMCDPIWHVSSRSGDGRLACKLLYPSLLLTFYIDVAGEAAVWGSACTRAHLSA